jgi:hypothetical protein
MGKRQALREVVPARRASITRLEPPGGRLPASATGVLTSYPDWASRKQKKDRGSAPVLGHPRAPESTKRGRRGETCSPASSGGAGRGSLLVD